MSNTYEVNGTYGASRTPCTVLVLETYRGFCWYCVEGSKNVNATYDEISDGVDVEYLSDFDCFTASNEINTTDELENEVVS